MNKRVNVGKPGPGEVRVGRFPDCVDAGLSMTNSQGRHDEMYTPETYTPRVISCTVFTLLLARFMTLSSPFAPLSLVIPQATHGYPAKPLALIPDSSRENGYLPQKLCFGGQCRVPYAARWVRRSEMEMVHLIIVVYRRRLSSFSRLSVDARGAQPPLPRSKYRRLRLRTALNRGWPGRTLDGFANIRAKRSDTDRGFLDCCLVTWLPRAVNSTDG